MIINLFLILLGLGCFSVLYRNLRFQNMWAACFAVLLTGGLWHFINGWQNGITDNFSYLWLTSRYYPVSLEFASNAINYALTAPFFCAAVICVFYIVGSGETQKLYLCGLTVLHFAALIMLITAQNTIQILVGTCFIDVFGFLLINNVPARRQYIFYNLLTNMGLFMGFAMLWGDCFSVLLNSLPTCLRHGNNFALWLILLSAVVKIGLFPFQGYWLPIAALSSSRKNILCFLSTPICGFLILYKTYAFFPSTFGLSDILRGLFYASIIWGVLGGLWIKKLEEKKLYLNLMLYGFACGHLAETSGTMLGEIYLLSLTLQIGLDYSRGRYGAVVTAVLLNVSAVMAVILPTAGLNDNIYLAALVAVIGCLMPQLYNRDSEMSSVTGIMLAAAVSSYLLYKHIPLSSQTYYWFGILNILGLLRLYRTDAWQWLYNCQSLQTAEFFARIFYILIVAPIEFLGRILLLTIDFLIIERTLLGALSESKRRITAGYIKLHDSGRFGTLIFFAAGLAMICGCLYWRK